MKFFKLSTYFVYLYLGYLSSIRYYLGFYFLIIFFPTLASAQTNKAKDNFLKGELELHLGDFRQALLYYDKAILDYPMYDDAFFARGKTNYWLDNISSAERDFARALQINPNRNDANAYLGIIYYLQQRYNDALPLFDKALKNNTKYTLAYNYRAETHFSLQNYEKAILDYTKAIQLEPKEPKFYAGRAKCALAFQKPQDAMNDYAQASNFDTQNPSYLLLHGEIAYFLKDCAVFLKDFEKYQNLLLKNFKKNPKNNIDSQNIHTKVDAQYLNWALDCELKKDNTAKSIVYLEELIKRNPNNPEFLIQKARLLQLQKRIPEAIDAVTKAILANSEDSNYYNYCAELYLIQNDIPKTIAYLHSAHLTEPKNSDYVYRLGQLYHQQKQKKDAKYFFELAVTNGFPKEKCDKIAMGYMKKAYKKLGVKN